MQSEHYRIIEPLPRVSNKPLPRDFNKLNQVIFFNPSVTQDDLNEINGADGRVFKFLEVELHLFL